MTVRIVWDWNGTLLDDLDLVVRAVSRSISRFGVEPISPDDYRDHYTRPVRDFYNSLFGRVVDDMEWEVLNKTFHDEYYSGVDDAALTVDAVPSLEHAASLGWSQSLLSMSTHSRLRPTVAAHGIDHHFKLISGLENPTGDLKATYLDSHLKRQGIAPSGVVVIGDTPDDHHAADAVGATSILYDGGSHHRPLLEAAGAPVVDTLTDALRLVEQTGTA